MQTLEDTRSVNSLLFLRAKCGQLVAAREQELGVDVKVLGENQQPVLVFKRSWV